MREMKHSLHEGGRMRGGRGGGGRLFEHGAMRWLLLSLIGQKPSHGYELIKAIETRMAGVYAPSPGVIYPSLSLLEDMGAVSISTEGGKKLYAITEEGQRLLEDNAEVLARVEARMEAMKGKGGRPAEISEALEAFRHTLRQKLGHEPALEAEEVARIAAIIREATNKIAGA
ncbi:PadR family transcriptional regulator [Brevundimonas sp. GN22]